MTDRKHEKYDRLLARAKQRLPLSTAVAHPCDESSFAGAVDAVKLGLFAPPFVTPYVDRMARSSPRET